VTKKLPPNAGKGRKPGVPNKLTRTLKEMIEQAVEAEGGVDYLRWAARKEPAAFLALLGKTLPRELTGPNGGPIQVQPVLNVSIAK
jgi:hypothetical protein